MSEDCAVLDPVGPVYTDDPDARDDLDALLDDIEGTVYAVCPSGHIAAVLSPRGAHHDHQPCPGAWWFYASAENVTPGE